MASILYKRDPRRGEPFGSPRIFAKNTASLKLGVFKDFAKGQQRRKSTKFKLCTIWIKCIYLPICLGYVKKLKREIYLTKLKKCDSI